MNTGSRRSYRPATAWEVEVDRFKALLERWLDYRLNSFFDLTIRGPKFRSYWILVLGAGFVAAGFVAHAVLYYYPVLAPSRVFSVTGLLGFFVITIARLVIILFIPSFLAIDMAGNYVADIFELKDPSVAWDFISDLSIGGARQSIHIREGKIAEESLKSPVLLIGGPGFVVVEFDSAALFEQPDGTPHVVGLANAKPAGVRKQVVLDGFERLREPIISLRDQYIGSLSGGEAITVVSRSLDGIPVSATDVRGVFSVRRKKPDDPVVASLQAPFGFDPKDIENISYKQAVPVLTEGPNPSGQPPPWTTSMQGLIKGSLSEFMSQHKLGEYLAGIGAVESDLSEFREDTIVSTTLRFSSELPDSKAQSPSKPTFHPRTELIDRFTKHADGFAKRAGERGLELHWIGVGTWKMPTELSDNIVNGQHLEAWQLNRENNERSGPEAVESISEEAYLSEKIRLIQNVPISAQQQNQARYSDKAVLIECLLQDYWDQLGDALAVYYQNGTAAPELEATEKAVLQIERLLKFRGHMVGGGTMSKVKRREETSMSDDAPPAPSSRIEAELYSALLSIVDGNYRVAEGLIANEARRHPQLERIELIRRIVSRHERHSK